MWMRLDDQELAALKELLADPPENCLKAASIIHDRVKHYENATDDRFRNAIDTDDELECDDDAVVSQSDEGAFVQTWTWVSNEEAGVDPDEDEG